jgi:hypothetical protein
MHLILRRQLLYPPYPGFLIRTDDMDFIGAADAMTADDNEVR